MIIFLAALQFLTIIPIKVRDTQEKELSEALIYFPLVGLLLGLILIGLNYLLIIFGFTQLITNIILVIFLIGLTGGIHLDGLSDTFDGISATGRSKEKVLEIMRDPHIGVMGALSIICIILLKISFLSAINPAFKFSALILMCVISRWAMVAAIFLFPYARKDGKAAVFMQGINPRIFLWSSAIAFGLALLAGGGKALLVIFITALGIYLFANFVHKRINGITGDTLGAINELAEVIALFVISLL